MHEQLLQAIQERRLIEFEYHEHHRVAEPHVYGRYGGKIQLLVYQVDGTSSSGGLPQWRRIELNEVTELSVLTDKFDGPRPTKGGAHTNWDEVYAMVR